MHDYRRAFYKITYLLLSDRGRKNFKELLFGKEDGAILFVLRRLFSPGAQRFLREAFPLAEQCGNFFGKLFRIHPQRRIDAPGKGRILLKTAPQKRGQQ